MISIKNLDTGKMIDCEYNDALADGIANIKENFGVEE